MRPTHVDLAVGKMRNRKECTGRAAGMGNSRRLEEGTIDDSGDAYPSAPDRFEI